MPNASFYSFAMNEPIRLLCIGKHREMALKVEAVLRPSVIYPAIIDDDLYQQHGTKGLETMFNALNPRPDGIIVGSGFSTQDVDEIGTWVKQWNENVQKEAGDGSDGVASTKQEIKFISLETGMMQTMGFEAVIQMVKQRIEEVFRLKVE